MLQADFWMVSLDLKSGYYHVPVHPQHTKFLTMDMGRMLVSFQALPFGLSTAPRIFQKVMRALVAEIRGKGLRVLPYIDDFLLLATSTQQALKQRAIIGEFIQRLGLTRNVEKGFWAPTQDLIHLGVGIDTQRQIFYIPPPKACSTQQVTGGGSASRN
eukprot:m.323018 g.323018  ORF g.323018 m.323018 type:complete len:158 (+) comp55519_c0_seq23:846-1319(+)